MQQRSVCIVRFPFTNLLDYEIRPAVIISNEKFNQKHNYFLCCPVNSRQSLKDFEIEIAEKDFEGNLKETSFIRVDSVAGIEKELFLKEIGSISNNLFENIKVAINKNL